MNRYLYSAIPKSILIRHFTVHVHVDDSQSALRPDLAFTPDCIESETRPAGASMRVGAAVIAIWGRWPNCCIGAGVAAQSLSQLGWRAGLAGGAGLAGLAGGHLAGGASAWAGQCAWRSPARSRVRSYDIFEYMRLPCLRASVRRVPLVVPLHDPDQRPPSSSQWIIEHVLSFLAKLCHCVGYLRLRNCLCPVHTHTERQRG